MLEYSMHIRWSEEDETFIATCPEFNDASAFGATPARAAKQLQEALALVVITHRDKGWPLPEPEKLVASSGQLRLRLPKSLHSSLTTRASREGTSLNTLIVSLLSDRLAERTVAELVAREFRSALAPGARDARPVSDVPQRHQDNGVQSWSTGATDDTLTASIASEGSADYNAQSLQP